MNPPDAPRDRVGLFAALCDLDPDARVAALDELRRADPALATEVERMLASDAAVDGPMESLRGELAGAAERLLRERDDSIRPDRLGPWKLGEALGAGGMGEVWAAERVEGGFTQRAAVKLVRSGMASREVIARFAIERQLLARLEHPAIATLLDGGIAPDGRPWFAMERVDGVAITQHASERRLGLEERLRLFLTVLEAVDAAHRSLIVHRDLKPSNILVSADGEPKLLDFGLAKLLDPGFVADATAARTELRALTPAYAAPEQIRGEPASTATDVYALGVILYELLTGELPHPRRTGSETTLVTDVARETIERPSQRLRRLEGGGGRGTRFARRLQGDLDTVVVKALAADRGRRYLSVAAFSADILAFLDGRPIAARPDTAMYRLTKFVQRHRFGVTASGIVLAALLAALTISVRETRRANVSAHQARIEARRAERVKSFLVSVFEQADPERTMGAQLTAEKILEEGSRRLGNELAEEPQVRAELYDAVSRIQVSLGLLDEGLVSAERAVAERGRLFGPDSPEHARSLVTAANALVAQGRLDEAGKLATEAIRAFELSGDRRSVEYAKAISTQASIRMMLGDAAGANTLERDAHAIYARELGAEHPETLEHLSNLAVIESEQANYDEAIRTYREVLRVLEATEPKDSPKVLAVLLNLATALDIAGRTREALVEFERVLEGRRRIFPPGHPVLAETMQIVSLRLSRAGRGEEALALLRDARAIREQSDHPDVASVDNFIALTLVDLGRFAEAEVASRRSVARFQRDRGDADTMTQSARGTLANAVALQHRDAEALAIYEEVVAALTAGGQFDNPRLLRIRFGWGSTLARLGRLAESRRVLEAAQAIAREKLDARHPWFAEAELQFARLELIEGGASAVEGAEARIARAESIAAQGQPTPAFERLLLAVKRELAAVQPAAGSGR